MNDDRRTRVHTVFAELHDLFCADLDPMDSRVPDDPDNFLIAVQATVGPAGEPGGDTFAFVVCTPRWLASELASSPYLFARHYLIVARYDYAVIHNAISKIVAGTSGLSWDDVAQRIARYGHWEFEDYVPYAPNDDEG
jgi:hypothetical protein